MTLIRETDLPKLENLLKSTGLYLTTGPFVFHVRSSLPDMVKGIHTLYGDYKLATDVPFADHHVEVKASSLVRHWLKPEIQFFHNGDKPFLPVTFKQALALFEWGMNWCISHYHNEYLKLHAAVLEKNGSALIMPGLPGAGKSTLSAALTLSGWRLLSDEHALINLNEASVVPLCRPIGLKNNSIDLIRTFSDSSQFGPVSEDTHKGTVAHMKADIQTNSRDAAPVPVRWFVFPQYSYGVESQMRRITRGEACIRAAQQSFNYSILGERGFDALAGVIATSRCFEFKYSEMHEAVTIFEDLAAWMGA